MRKFLQNKKKQYLCGRFSLAIVEIAQLVLRK